MRSIAELSRKFRQEMEKEGVTMEDLMSNLESAKKKMYLERRAKRAREKAEEKGATPEEELNRLLDKSATNDS
jgi:hypothetical protein